MTTHIQKIQALGNRIVSNLTTMGVSATFGDGALTLADKILQIQHFTNGLLLYADKDIVQTGDTLNLYALLLNDGKAVSGETIYFDRIFKSTPTRVTLTSDKDYFTKKYDIITIPEDTHIYLDKNQEVWLTRTPMADYIAFIINGNMIDTGTNFSMDNGIITYTDLQNTTKTYDLTDYNCGVVHPHESGYVIDDYSYYAVTGSDGVATVSYSAEGSGLLNIKAVCGIISSKTYSVFDCLYFDGMTSDTLSNYFVNNGNSLVFDSDKLRVTRVIDGECYVQYEPDVANYKGKTVKFECDINAITQTNLRIYQMVNGSFSNVGGNFITTGTASVSATIDANATRIIFRVNGNNLGTDGTLTFKNFKVYPI